MDQRVAPHVIDSDWPASRPGSPVRRFLVASSSTGSEPDPSGGSRAGAPRSVPRGACQPGRIGSPRSVPVAPANPAGSARRGPPGVPANPAGRVATAPLGPPPSSQSTGSGPEPDGLSTRTCPASAAGDAFHASTVHEPWVAGARAGPGELLPVARMRTLTGWPERGVPRSRGRSPAEAARATPRPRNPAPRATPRNPGVPAPAASPGLRRQRNPGAQALAALPELNRDRIRSETAASITESGSRRPSSLARTPTSAAYSGGHVGHAARWVSTADRVAGSSSPSR